jgi:beta-glucosidase
MDDIETLLERLTLEEKAALCAGASMWLTTAIPRLGIPALKLSDGPIGVRGGNLTGGLRSACFPNASALGATWSPEQVEEMGVALGEEAKTKGVHVVLGPTVNLHRSPLGGRHFEAYSEDPLLTSRLCVAFVRGVQSQGVGTSVKHYVANDSEFERMSISSEVDERTLREVYLRPFEAAVAEVGPWTIMAAYNQVNGRFCTAHRELLVGVLEEEWGFDGVVVSDWFAIKDTVLAANGGLDLEMPGPARFFGEALVVAVKDGRVAEAEIDRKVRRMLRLIERTGALPGDVEVPERAVDRPEHRALARRLATESAVLLRNEGGLLPLRREGLERLAVIGPNAATTSALGGGSARVAPHYETHALEAIRAAAGEVEVVFEPGCSSHRTVPVLDTSRVVTPEGDVGFELAFFDSLDLSGPPAEVRTVGNAEQTWLGEIAPGIDPLRFSARLSGRYTPDVDGMQTFALGCAGKARLRVDGEEVLDQWRSQEPGETWFGAGSKERTVDLPLEAGRPVELVVEYTSEGVRTFDGMGITGVKLGHMRAIPDDSVERAATAAREADAAVVIVGLNAEWESEGGDKADMRLPGRQEELIERVAAANASTIVVVNAGAPLELPWADRAPALLWAWYGGQEAGRAIADLLFGDASPGGRLPTTFPERLEDSAAHSGDPLSYPGREGRVEYREGVFVGHRHFDRAGLEPRFPFGFGLSYTGFAYGEAELEGTPGSDDFALHVEVCNTGAMTGSEVVQVYLGDLEASVPRPEQELVAFAKVQLAAGERRRVRLPIPLRALCFWSTGRHAWLAEAGTFELRVGRSSRDHHARLLFELASEIEVPAAPGQRGEGG